MLFISPVLYPRLEISLRKCVPAVRCSCLHCNRSVNLFNFEEEMPLFVVLLQYCEQSSKNSTELFLKIQF